jgi:hypothetical protein
LHCCQAVLRRRRSSLGFVSIGSDRSTRRFRRKERTHT